MKAAVLFAYPGDLDVVDVTIDGPGPHEVLVQTVASGLCHSDLHRMDGSRAGSVPIVLGHEAAGIVVEVGAEVKRFAVGDHVVGCVTMACGFCRYCSSGNPALCVDRPGRGPADPPALSFEGRKVAQGGGAVGGFAERMLVPEQGLVKIDQRLPLEQACLMGCAVMTGLGAVFRTARVRPGASVAVIGCGGIGLSAVQGARLAGAANIIAIDLVDDKLERARTVGATATVNASEVDDVVAAVADLTSGGVEYSFEASGNKTAAEQAFEMLQPMGTSVMMGLLPTGTRLNLTIEKFLVECKVLGSRVGSNQYLSDIPEYVDLALQGRLDLGSMVTDRLKLDDINGGFDAMKRREGVRQVIVFDS